MYALHQQRQTLLYHVLHGLQHLIDSNIFESSPLILISISLIFSVSSFPLSPLIICSVNLIKFTEENETLLISRIVNESNIVAYFTNKKLNVGDKLTVTSQDSANDSLQVKNVTQGIDIELSSSASQYLFVEHSEN